MGFNSGFKVLNVLASGNIGNLDY